MTTVRLGVIAQRCALMFGIAALIGACGDSGSKGLGNSGGGAGTGGTTDGGPGDSGNFQVLDAYVLPRRDLGRDTDGGLGTFRDSCQDNLDCQSGWCVPFEDHNVCSQQCLDQGCPDGWSCHAVANTDPDVVFICFPPGNRLCGVCLQDADCPHGHCFALDGLNVCGVDCESDDTCPKDYACKTVSDDPATPKQCAPKTNSCTCDVKHDGDERVCEKAGAVGTCYGRETCDPTAGWTGCSAPDPKPEVCNQQDDDCNGLTDDIEGLGGPCERTVDVGGAQRSCAGRLICTRESETPTCTASEPRAELCNYLDDDCNGDTDETFPERGAICEVGQGVCRRVGVTECTDDGSGTRCNVVEGQPEAEKCDGLDNDCDGQTDEDFEGVNDPCFNGVGACRRAAALRCNADGSGVECPAVPGQPTPEICDGLDNNCDGTTDEGFDGLFEPCDDGVGACRRTGFRYCTEDGQHVACTAAASQPSPELCNGVDDDCDGQTDEDFPNVNTVCTNGEGFCQRAGVNVCAPDGHGTICTAPNSDPQPERCDGLDNDCDGQIDEDFADLDTICTAGDGACQRVGIVVCSADGAQAVCSAVAAVPQPEICNGLDDNCDGRVDEGFADLARPCSAGEGACLSFGVNRCSADGQSVVCDATPGDPVDEICDNVDNDCDGQTDEDFDGIDAPCATGIGACARAGLGACSDDGASVVCNAVAGQPSPELCNGLDDNCDGRVDEAFPALNERCESGRGECHRVGIQTCSADGHGTTCTVGAADPRAEICDGLDNDCDGVVDNGFAGINTPCTVGQGECTRIGVRSCSADGQSVVCNAEAGPVAPETCDGRDNNCDGRVDESFPDVNTPCHAGQGACLRYGVFGCSADGSGTACSASPGAPSPDVCDGIDNNCDGRTDENNANLGTTCSKGLGACRRSGVFVCDPANAAGPTLCDADTVAPPAPPRPATTRTTTATAWWTTALWMPRAVTRRWVTAARATTTATRSGATTRRASAWPPAAVWRATWPSASSPASRASWTRIACPTTAANCRSTPAASTSAPRPMAARTWPTAAPSSSPVPPSATALCGPWTRAAAGCASPTASTTRA